jgi:hypothetical protein
MKYMGLVNRHLFSFMGGVVMRGIGVIKSPCSPKITKLFWLTLQGMGIPE